MQVAKAFGAPVALVVLASLRHHACSWNGTHDNEVRQVLATSLLHLGPLRVFSNGKMLGVYDICINICTHMIYYIYTQ